MANASLSSAGGEQTPDAVRHLRHLDTQRGRLELLRPLGAAATDDHPLAEVVGDEGRLAGVPAGGRHPVRISRQSARELELGELADERGQVLEEPDVVLEHLERRGPRMDELGPLAKDILTTTTGWVAQRVAAQP